MIKKLAKFAFFFGAMSLFLIACDKDDDNNDDTKVTYESQIKTDLASCGAAGCHESGSQVGSLANYTDVVAFVGFGRILGAVKHESGFSPMPKGGDKWSDEKISRLEGWIKDGMPEK